MSEIFVNAPIQNKDFDPDVNMGKITTLFVADYLREQNDSPASAHLWNNVIAAQQKGYTKEEYDAKTEAMLEAKYQSQALKYLCDRETNALIITDTDQSFCKWAGKIVSKSLENGDIKIKYTDCYVCSGCEATLNHAEGPETQCIACPDSRTLKTKRDALTIVIDDNVLRAVAKQSGNKEASALVGQIPQGLQTVNKRRISGIPLDEFGFPGDVLDPRIGLGLTALYAAYATASDSVGIVVARSSLHMNMPQFLAATLSQSNELPALRQYPIQRSPAGYLAYLLDEQIAERDFLYHAITDRLSPVLLRAKKPVSPQTAEQVIFSRKASKRMEIR